jgi:Flp pilus assembly protein TadB
MLSDRERETLRELEQRILDEDHRFARSFEARARHLPSGSAAGPGMRIFLIVGLLVSALALVAGSLGFALAFALATGLIWLVWRLDDAVPPRRPS